MGSGHPLRTMLLSGIAQVVLRYALIIPRISAPSYDWIRWAVDTVLRAMLIGRAI